MQETRSMADLLPTSPRMDEETRLLLPEAPSEVQTQLDTTRGAALHALDAVKAGVVAAPLAKAVVLAVQAEQKAGEAVKSAASVAWGTALNTVGVQTTDQMNPNANLEAAKQAAQSAVKSAGDALNVALNPVAMVNNAIAESKKMMSSSSQVLASAANGNFFGSGDANSSQKQAA